MPNEWTGNVDREGAGGMPGPEARAQSVDTRRTRLDLCMFASETADAFRPLVAQRRQNLDVFVPPVPAWVNADPVRLYQIISNLLLNASNFTPADGRVWVHLDAMDDRVALTVGDTGRGIAPEMLPRVFDALPRGPAGGRVGLGLAVVKQLAALHGGTVEGFSDGPGCGSRFVVTLPASESTARSARARAGQPVEGDASRFRTDRARR